MKRRHFIQTGITGLSLVTGKAMYANENTGYFMPAEEEPHDGCIMQWPVNKKIHSDRYFLRDLQNTIAHIANTINDFEPVILLADKEYHSAIKKKVSSNIEIWDIPTDDLWARDSGPVFVKNANNGFAIMSTNFNGWGGKQYHKNDGEIQRRVADFLGMKFVDFGLVGEAGGMEFDGEATMIAHESSFVNKNRDSSSKAVITEKLKKSFGAQKVIWSKGLYGEDITDYHIDSLARFTRPGEILFQMPFDDDSDPFAMAAFDTLDILMNARDAHGREITIKEIPTPENPRIKSLDFVSSYVNYYLANNAVIMSEFGDRETDEIAYGILKGIYPKREIVMINTDEVGEIGGGIHCATQQIPRGAL